MADFPKSIHIHDGTKMWISNALAADFVMVQAVTDPEKRQRDGITMFLVDRSNPGMKVVEGGLPTWLDQTPSPFIVNFDDCRVPDAAVLGKVGQGFAWDSGGSRSWTACCAGPSASARCSAASTCRSSGRSSVCLFYRYVRHARIGGGTEEIQRMMIARMLLK